MINKKPNIDQAWSALYSRLQNDSLLSEEVFIMKKRKMTLSVRWIAACVIVILSATFFFYNYSDKEAVELLTLQNTEKDNVLVKTLDDGSTIYLASNASVSYPKSFASDQRQVTLKGEALFDISKNPTKPFLIDAGKVTVKVLGTAFKVKSAADGSFELTVQRGRVRVTENVGGESIVVSVGQSVKSVGNHLHKFLNTDQNIFDHYIAKMRFKDETLANIVHVINQNNHTFVVLKGNLLKSNRLNVQFYNNNVDEMTQIITLALNLKREIRQDTIYISQP